MTSRDIRAVVLSMVREINLQLPADQQLALDDAAPILAPGSPLDSLATLNFLVGVEERCASELGLGAELLDEELLADGAGPLATVGSLVSHLQQLSVSPDGSVQ